MARDRALWSCPRCGRQFANRNQWHSCVTIAVAEHVRGATPVARSLFRAWEAAVRACGPVRAHATKTRIGFIARMTFTAVTLKKRWIDTHLILPRRIDDARFRKIEVFGPTTYVHHLRIRDVAEIDDRVRAWLRLAYRVGRQEFAGRGPTLLAGLLFAAVALAAAGPALAQSGAGPDEPGRAPFAHMHTILEKTIFRVDVLRLDLCLDSATAARVGRFAGQGPGRAADDSIANAARAAPNALARIRFLRNVSYGQFLGGVIEEQKHAVDAGLLADSTYRAISGSLPEWFSFLENRDILDGDEIVYRIRGDTLRSTYISATGPVLMDRTDTGRERTTSVLATYLAPGSGFRRGLLRSLARPEPGTAPENCRPPPDR